MTTRNLRPTLADLWRDHLLVLEGLGVEDAPALARSLAIAAWSRSTSPVDPGSAAVETSGRAQVPTAQRDRRPSLATCG